MGAAPPTRRNDMKYLVLIYVNEAEEEARGEAYREEVIREHFALHE